MISLFPQNIRHIFFDLDHTLWDYDRNAEETLIQIHRNYNLAMHGLEPLALFIENFHKANIQVWDLFEETNMNQFELRHKRMELVFESFGLKPLAIEGLNEAYYHGCSRGRHLIKGALDLVRNLSEQFHLHIITNGFEDIQYIKLENTGLSPFFKTVTTSEKAGSKKPEKAYFEFALNLAGAKREESLVVGDGLRTDVAGAINSELPVIWFNRDRKQKPYQEILEVKELWEIHTILNGNG